MSSMLLLRVFDATAKVLAIPHKPCGASVLDGIDYVKRLTSLASLVAIGGGLVDVGRRIARGEYMPSRAELGSQASTIMRLAYTASGYVWAELVLAASPLLVAYGYASERGLSLPGGVLSSVHLVLDYISGRDVADIIKALESVGASEIIVGLEDEGVTASRAITYGLGGRDLYAALAARRPGLTCIVKPSTIAPTVSRLVEGIRSDRLVEETARAWLELAEHCIPTLILEKAKKSLGKGAHEGLKALVSLAVECAKQGGKRGCEPASLMLACASIVASLSPA